MDVDHADSPSGQPLVSRDKTAPFLIRTFAKIGGFHRLNLFEDAALPTTDEHQIFAWRDATLREVLTTLRNTSPHVAEFKHPLARFSFRTIYADSANKGRFASKDLGMVYSRDILGEPGSLGVTAPRLQEDVEPEPNRESTVREKEERTLEELRFVPGDFLCVSVILPKGATAPSELSIKGVSGPNRDAPAVTGWKNAGGPRDRDRERERDSGAPARGAGGGHWRGGPDSLGRGGGRGGFGGRGGDRDRERERDLRDRDRDMDRDTDRRVPPPRRHDFSPPRGGNGWGSRGGGGAGRGRHRDDRRSRSRSRSRSPPRRRGRYD